MASGLPVTMPVSASPLTIERVSINHAMTFASVLTSGAGTSRSGPIIEAMPIAYLRVRRSSSLVESVIGSTWTPPFAPPKGTSTTAHLSVMSAASAMTSCAVTD